MQKVDINEITNTRGENQKIKLVIQLDKESKYPQNVFNFRSIYYSVYNKPTKGKRVFISFFEEMPYVWDSDRNAYSIIETESDVEGLMGLIKSEIRLGQKRFQKIID